MHTTDRSCRYYIQDVFFWRLAGPVAPTGKAIVHWIGCINAINILFSHSLFTSKACHKRHFQMKNISASICSKVTLTSRFQYMSTEVANRAERVKVGLPSYFKFYVWCIWRSPNAKPSLTQVFSYRRVLHFYEIKCCFYTSAVLSQVAI